MSNFLEVNLQIINFLTKILDERMSGGMNVLSPLPAGHFLQEQATDNPTPISAVL